MEKIELSNRPYIVDIQQDCDSWNNDLPDNLSVVRDAIIATLDSHHIESAEIAVLLADDSRIQELNLEFRGKDSPTNVLAFPAFVISADTMHSVLDDKNHPMIGDIIISFDTMFRESIEQNKSLADHVSHLIIHSTLHLLGYDHEIADDAELMEEVEIDILKSLGVGNPY